jgi:hypothetical protein
MNHGIYEQKWYPVMYGKGTRSSKVGEIFLKLLLHKEGLTKEQRRSSIQSNMASLKEKSASESGKTSRETKNITQQVVASNNTGSVNTDSVNNLQSQIELETRLIGMEKSIAQVTEMMANIVERLASTKK